MNPFASWLAVKLLLALEPHERDALRGDHAELGVSGTQALRDVLSLVVRRQLELWKDWRPWLTLCAGVLPLGALLSLAPRGLGADGFRISWFYFVNWTPAYLETAGSRSDLLHYALILGNDCLVLACWSWAAGFLVGSLSRRAIASHGVLFCLAIWFAVLLPSRFGTGPLGAIVPRLLQWGLLLLPAIWGMRQGRRSAIAPPSQRHLLFGLASVTVALLALRNWDLALAAWGPLQACREWISQPSGAGCIALGREMPTLPPLPYRMLFSSPDQVVVLGRQAPTLPTLPLTLIGPVGYIATKALWRYSRKLSATA